MNTIYILCIVQIHIYMYKYNKQYENTMNKIHFLETVFHCVALVSPELAL